MITELKPLHILYSSIEYEDGTHDSGSDYVVYDKDAVDAVLKEKDAEIARLKQELANNGGKDAVHLAIRKLLKALWTVRMKFMWSECRWFSACNPDYIRNREGYTPNSSKEKQMGCLQWARLFYKNYELCKRQVAKFNSWR